MTTCLKNIKWMNAQYSNNMKYFLMLLFLVFFEGYAQDNTFFNIARKGTIEEAQKWLSQNPNSANQANERGFSPLILACYSGNYDMVAFLINNKVDVNYNSSEGTALMSATVKGNIKMVELLLKNNANPNLTNQAGITALMYAVQFKNVAIVTLLLEHKANKLLLDKEGKSAFEYAVFSGNEEIIKLLK